MRIVLFGAPGVGKGSQARLLMKNEGLVHISTGVILREAIREGSPTGRIARKYIDKGRLVPGPVVRKLAETAIEDAGCDRFVLDGYPRTIEQAEWLTEFLSERNAPLHAVVSLSVSDDVIVDRLSKRRVNLETGENYHLDFKPPPNSIGAAIVFQREDDRPEAIMSRLAVYRKETRPVEEYYRSRRMLLDIDGIGAFETVHHRIVEAVRIFARQN